MRDITLPKYTCSVCLHLLHILCAACARKTLRHKDYPYSARALKKKNKQKRTKHLLSSISFSNPSGRQQGGAFFFPFVPWEARLLPRRVTTFLPPTSLPNLPQLPLPSAKFFQMSATVPSTSLTHQAVSWAHMSPNSLGRERFARGCDKWHHQRPRAPSSRPS